MVSFMIRAIALILFLAPRFAFAVAGPPLITDDPGTPGPGNWEINLAVTADSSDANYTYGVPFVDLNYGWGDRIQLKYQVPWSLTKDKDAGISHDGFDRSQAGVKWRFQDKESSGVAISTYPQITFPSPVPVSIRNPDVGNGTDFFLPLEAEETLGHWDFNEELGFNWVDQSQGQVEGGLAITYTLNESLIFLGEIHERVQDSFSDHELLVNLGTVFAINHLSNGLFAIGRSLHDFGGVPHRLLVFAGIQLHF
jgi:hypothetical protein